MIEPNGTPVDVLGVKNNQSSKQPNGGMPQRQDTAAGGSLDRAHDDSSFGGVGTGGIADNVPGSTQRLDDCLKQAQDSGSHAAGISVGAKVNVGAPGWSGTKPVDVHQVYGGDAGTNGEKSVDGNVSPMGRGTTAKSAGQKDIGTSTGMLPGFPRGIIE